MGLEEYEVLAVLQDLYLLNPFQTATPLLDTVNNFNQFLVVDGVPLLSGLQYEQLIRYCE